MTPDNTLLGRCTVAYAEAFEAAITSQAVAPQSRRAGVAAVLEHLAAELLVLNQRNDRLTVHELSRLLLAAAQGQEGAGHQEAAFLLLGDADRAREGR